MMNAKFVFVQCLLLFSAVALAHSWDASHIKDVTLSFHSNLLKNSVGEAASTTARALKSARKFSKEFSGGSADVFRAHSRRLLSEDPGCEWDEGECAVAPAKRLELLSSASSDVAQLGVSMLRCTLASSEAMCVDIGCAWVDGKCSFEEIFGAPEDCIGDLAKLVNYDEMDVACDEDFNTVADCNADSLCTWDEDEDRCSFDLLGAITGVPFVNGSPVGLDEALRDYLNWLLITSISDGIATSADPNVILAWKPRAYDCPVELASILCATVQTSRETFVATLYCRRKFPRGSSSDACNSDPMCAVDDNGGCSVGPAVQKEAVKASQDALFASVDDPNIRDAIAPFVQCPPLEEADCVGLCVWESETGECSVDVAAQVKSFGEVAQENPEPSCAFWGAAFMAGCIEATDEDCEGNPSCEIDEDGDCTFIVEDVIVDVVLGEDETLSTAFDEAEAECKGKLSEQECR